jgi:hypothetical protein
VRGDIEDAVEGVLTFVVTIVSSIRRGRSSWSFVVVASLRRALDATGGSSLPSRDVIRRYGEIRGRALAHR